MLWLVMQAFTLQAVAGCRCGRARCSGSVRSNHIQIDGVSELAPELERGCRARSGSAAGSLVLILPPPEPT